MILPTGFVLFVVAVASLYFYLQRQPGRSALWRRALTIGLVVGIARAALASIGWYVVEHTGGVLQVPAYALAMLAVPEGMLVSGRRLTPAPGQFYVLLCLVLIAGTLLVVSAVAVIAGMTRTSQR